MMKLKELLKGVSVLEMTADPELEVTDLCCDSRKAVPGVHSVAFMKIRLVAPARWEMLSAL